MEQARYVIEWSEDFGKPPARGMPTHELVNFAEQCGIKIPFDVRREMGVEKAMGS